MLRRAIDLSWPLIFILTGLFLVSLRLPREWEQIARPSRLVLQSSKPLEQSLPDVSAAQREELPMEVFRAIQPAARIADNAGSSVPNAAANVEIRPATAAPAAVPNMPGSQVNAVTAPVDESPRTAGMEAGPKLPSAEPDLPRPTTSVFVEQHPAPVESKGLAATVPEPATEVRVLRDVPSAGRARSLPSAESVSSDSPLKDPANAADPEVHRLPPPSSQLASNQKANSQPAVAGQAGPTASHREVGAMVVPEPNGSVVDAVANPLRAVVPEPELRADQPATPKPRGLAPDVAADNKSNDAATTSQPNENPEVPGTTISQPIAEAPMKAIGREWVEPKHLLLQLEDLAKNEATRRWASAALAEVRKLGPAISSGAPETTDILQRLDLLTRETPTLLLKINNEPLAQQLSRASHAMERHVTVWNQIGKMGGLAAADVPAPAVDHASFNKCLSEIDRMTNASPEGRAWRSYLMFESLRDWAARRRNNDERLPRELALQVLKRLNPMSVSSHQRQFLTTGPLGELQREMVRHTAEPVQSSGLLRHMENYETSGLPSDARLLARDCEYLAVGSAAARELGERFDMHYRNANIRIAVSAELMNRMIPKREPEYAAVQDTIQNVPVRGQSLMANDIAVRLIPDPHRALLALEVNGEVASVTTADAGQAVFYSDSESSYVARKRLELTLRGIQPGETEVAVNNRSTLRGVSTKFENVPLLGRIAKDVAISEHDQGMPAAEAEVREKIAARAKERVDRETNEQIATAAKRLQDELLGPMDSMMLDPTMISAETTDKRFNMRIRLAGADQLGGHTPRPQAPSDSLASVQIHESMLNNMLERLELDGETFDLAGLGQRLHDRLHRFHPRPVDPDQEDVKITFAAKDALRVRCNDGRLEITLSIARLSKGTDKWKDIQVTASYRPVVQGRSVDLVRDGIVQLSGPRIRLASQIALRGVFSKVFSQKEPIHVTPETFVKNPKLDGIVVTQFVIDDGWIGAAIGPQRAVAQRTTRMIR
jgi:hypothetical protein